MDDPHPEPPALTLRERRDTGGIQEAAGAAGVRRAVLRAVDHATKTATVQLTGSLPQAIAGVPFARHLPAFQATAGSSCALLQFDPANPADAVIVAIFDAPFVAPDARNPAAYDRCFYDGCRY